MADLDVAEVEKFLYKLDESTLQLESTDNHVIQLDVIDLGSWIIKLRKRGIVINNADLVFVDLMDITATISFKSNSFFWQVLNGGFDFDDELLKNNIKQSGNSIALGMFRKLCIKPFDSQLQQSNTNLSASVPVRAGRIMSSDGQQPLKAGFLLKKRDILAGWRCRYFVVYPGRLEYYIDQHDIHSRATISLVGAEICPSKRTTVNGVSEHWGLLVKTKNPDKTFRLASELSGMEGMVETTTWEQVFNIATKLTLEPSPSATSSPRVTEGSRGKKSNPAKAGTTAPLSSTARAVGATSAANISNSSSSTRRALLPVEGLDSSLRIQGAIIAVLLLATYCVYQFSSVQNKAVYIALSIVLTSVLIGMFVTQLQAKVKMSSGGDAPPAPTTTSTTASSSTVANSTPRPAVEVGTSTPSVAAVVVAAPVSTPASATTPAVVPIVLAPPLGSPVSSVNHAATALSTSSTAAGSGVSGAAGVAGESSKSGHKKAN